jgi:GAF domain-containing protein
MRDNRPSAALCTLLEEVGRAADLRELLCALERRLGALLAFDAIRIYRPGESDAAGEIRRGAGASRPAFSRDPRRLPPPAPVFRSMLAAPLEDGDGVVGVLALYSVRAAAFSPEDLGALLWIRADLTRAIRKAMRAEEWALA